MIIDNRFLKRVFSGTKQKPAMTLNAKTGAIRFNWGAVELFGLAEKERLHFRILAEHGKLYLVVGVCSTAIKANIKVKSRTCNLNAKSVTEAMMKGLSSERVAFSILPKIEQRYEGFDQYPLIQVV